MTIEASDIITSVRRRLRQTVAARSNWTDSQLLTYMNDVVEEVCRATDCYRTYAKYESDGGTRYPLPSNMIRPINVTSPDGEVPWLTLTDVNPGAALPIENLFITGVYGAKILGEFIYFLPAPASARFLHYYGYPPVSPDTPEASFDLPKNVRMAIIYGTMAEALTEIEKYDKAALFGQKYQAEIESAKENENAKQKAGPMRIKRPRIAAWR